MRYLALCLIKEKENIKSLWQLFDGMTSPFWIQYKKQLVVFKKNTMLHLPLKPLNCLYVEC